MSIDRVRIQSAHSDKVSALLLILLVALLVLGIGLIVQSGYNLWTLETLTTVVDESAYYIEAGYSSVAEWRSRYMQVNTFKIALGALLAAASGYLMVKARWRRHLDANKT